MFFKRKDSARKHKTSRSRGLQYVLVLLCTSGVIAVVIDTSTKAINAKLNAVHAALKKR